VIHFLLRAARHTYLGMPGQWLPRCRHHGYRARPRLMLTALLYSAAAAVASRSNQGTAPPRLNISPRCNASILSSNYNAGFQSRENWEFSAWRTYTGFIRPLLLDGAERPRTIVDVGCGFALYDIHVHRHYNHAVKIIYFDQAGPRTSTRRGDKAFKLTGGWHANISKMPFYHHDRSCLKEIATDNGVPEANIELLDANVANMKALGGRVDLIYSHMSWGFHYPVDTYASAAFDALRPGGRLILTLIRRFTNHMDGRYKVGDRWHKVDPDREMEVAVRAGFLCEITNRGYRSERLKVMVCVKPASHSETG
jgi:SAM-dependent methyltransferase